MSVPSELVPESLLDPRRKSEFMDWLFAQFMPGFTKVEVARWWAQWIGVTLSQRDLAKIKRSGPDYTGGY